MGIEGGVTNTSQRDQEGEISLAVSDVHSVTSGVRENLKAGGETACCGNTTILQPKYRATSIYCVYTVCKDTPELLYRTVKMKNCIKTKIQKCFNYVHCLVYTIKQSNNITCTTSEDLLTQ